MRNFYHQQYGSFQKSGSRIWNPNSRAFVIRVSTKNPPIFENTRFERPQMAGPDFQAHRTVPPVPELLRIVT